MPTKEVVTIHFASKESFGNTHSLNDTTYLGTDDNAARSNDKNNINNENNNNMMEVTAVEENTKNFNDHAQAIQDLDRRAQIDFDSMWQPQMANQKQAKATEFKL